MKSKWQLIFTRYLSISGSYWLYTRVCLKISPTYIHFLSLCPSPHSKTYQAKPDSYFANITGPQLLAFCLSTSFSKYQIFFSFGTIKTKHAIFIDKHHFSDGRTIACLLSGSCARYSCESINPLSFRTVPYGAYSGQMKKMGCREVKYLYQDHTVTGSWRSETQSSLGTKFIL